MKKRFIYLAAAALSFVAFSCSKETELNPDEVTGLPDTPQTEEKTTPEGYVRFSIAADVESVTTKTSLEDGETAGEKIVKWVDGDGIDVLFEGGSSTSEASVSGSGKDEKTSFDIDVLPGTTQVYLSYPEGSGAVLDGESVSLTIPSVQSGAFADVSYLLATCTADAPKVTFYSAASFFKITLSDARCTNWLSLFF